MDTRLILEVYFAVNLFAAGWALGEDSGRPTALFLVVFGVPTIPVILIMKAIRRRKRKQVKSGF